MAGRSHVDARLIASWTCPCATAPSPKKASDAVLVLLVRGQRCPRRDRRPGSDDSVRAEHAGVDVGDMHRSALAVAVSSVLPSSSAIM